MWWSAACWPSKVHCLHSCTDPRSSWVSSTFANKRLWNQGLISFGELPRKICFPILNHIYVFWSVLCVCVCDRVKFTECVHCMCISSSLPQILYHLLQLSLSQRDFFLTDGRNKHTAFFIGLLHSPLNYWEIRSLGKHETSRSPALCWAVMRWQEMGNGTILAPVPTTVGVPQWSRGKWQNFCPSVW